MKKRNVLLVSAAVLFSLTAVLVIGCQKESKTTAPDEISLSPSSIPRILNGATYNGLKIPDGTMTEVLNNGSTVKIIYPRGVALVGTTPEGGIYRVIESEYTCTGSCTTGCDVLYAGGSFGCSACDPATTTCTGKAKALTEIVGKGFVNFDAGISFVSSNIEASNLFVGPDNLLVIPEVLQAMKAFNVKIHGTESPDFSNAKMYREVVLNLFGCKVMYMAPSSENPNASIVQEEELVEAAAWSCRCDAPAGSSGCTKDSGIGYKKCTSGACTSCTMIN